MKAVLLIDGDQFVFKATAALEKDTRWDDQNHVLYSNADECWTNVQSMLDRVFERFNSQSHALCFTSSPNFRRDIDPTYKMGRSTRKPLCYAEVRERCETKYNCLAMPGLEADDVMGILATKPGQAHNIIVSQDKDMRTIPTTVWNGKDLLNITVGQADYFHMYQTLIGDTSDGYKGCPGIGPVKATKLLDPPVKPELLNTVNVGALWQCVVAAYVEAKLTEEHAIIQARLSRILRWTDWDTENKKPILWTPPTSVASSTRETNVSNVESGGATP